VLLALWSTIMVLAQTKHAYYVAKNGDDSNPCTLTLPCATFNRVRTLPMPGDTVYVRGGDYTGSLIKLGATGVQNGTDWSEGSGAITWKAYNSEIVWVGSVEANNAYYIFDGINIDGSALHSFGLGMYADHVLFKNAEIRNAVYDGISGASFGPGVPTYHYTINLKVHDNGNTDPSPPAVQHHGYYLDGGDYNLIEYCDFYNHKNAMTESYGIQLFDNTFGSMPSHNILRFNKFHDNGRGIFVGSGASNNQIYNNLVYNNLASGVDVGSGTNNQLYNNTIYGNGGFGVQMVTSTGALVKNNLIANSGSYDVYIWGAGAMNDRATLLNNLTTKGISDFGNATTLSGNITGSPKLVDPAAGNFHLLQGSIAIGAGVNLISFFTTDFAGIARPAASGFDIGAYQYGTSTPPAGDAVAPTISLRMAPHQ